jgi:hypothetical protein
MITNAPFESPNRVNSKYETLCIENALGMYQIQKNYNSEYRLLNSTEMENF